MHCEICTKKKNFYQNKNSVTYHQPYNVYRNLSFETHFILTTMNRALLDDEVVWIGKEEDGGGNIF